MSYVYFAQAQKTGLIKIGYSRDVPQRLVNLSALGMGPVRLLGVVTGGDMLLEQAYHRRYRRSRVKGEWFRPSRAILAEAAHHPVDSPEQLPIFNRWGEKVRRVEVKLPVELVATLEMLAALNMRNLEGQITRLLKRAFETGLAGADFDPEKVERGLEAERAA